MNARKSTLMLLICLLMNAGCASLNMKDQCRGFYPIRPTAADVLVISDDLVEQLLSHNEYGKSHCRWGD